jgi:hypothetical protein
MYPSNPNSARSLTILSPAHKLSVFGINRLDFLSS